MTSINSLSSAMMLGITMYRNQPGLGNKVAAQVGYGLTTIVAIVESVVASAFCALSVVLYSVSPDLLNRSFEWLKSSSFTIIWSMADSIINIFARVLVADEKSARWIASTGQIFRIPPGAII